MLGWIEKEKLPTDGFDAFIAAAETILQTHLATEQVHDTRYSKNAKDLRRQAAKLATGLRKWDSKKIQESATQALQASLQGRIDDTYLMFRVYADLEACIWASVKVTREPPSEDAEAARTRLLNSIELFTNEHREPKPKLKTSRDEQFVSGLAEAFESAFGRPPSKYADGVFSSIVLTLDPGITRHSILNGLA